MKDYKLLIVNKDYEWHINTPIPIAKYKNNTVTGIGIMSIPVTRNKSYGDIIAIIQNGLMHNIDGAAAIHSDGSLMYWINGKVVGKNLSNKQFEQKIKEVVFE